VQNQKTINMNRLILTLLSGLLFIPGFAGEPQNREVEAINLEKLDSMSAELDSSTKALDESMQKMEEALTEQNNKAWQEQNIRNLNRMMEQQRVQQERKRKSNQRRLIFLGIAVVGMVVSYVARKQKGRADNEVLDN